MLPDTLARRIDADGDCWLWTGAQDGRGYGVAYDPATRTQGKAHRIVWGYLVGSIELGLTLDHLCRVRFCVNPDHLEPVTHAENNRRGFGFAAFRRDTTHCPRGHPYDLNTYYVPSNPGSRYCQACNRERSAERRERNRMKQVLEDMID